jgi:triacylglycerol lipase
MGDVIERSMRVLLPRAIPRIAEVQDLFRIGPSVEPADDDVAIDAFDRKSGKFAYRFFRDCEQAPFDLESRRFEPVNAWYLSEVALLAYADAKLEPDTESASERAAAMVTAQITSSMTRFFKALWARSEHPLDRELVIHTIVRESPVAGIEDPVQCVVADDGQVGIVAFRGTVPTSLPNWLTDCEINMVPLDPSDPDVRVHEGFLDAASALLADFGKNVGLDKYLQARRQKSPGVKFWFTGHSFGAAMATLTSFRIGGVEALYTYGSPRVGNIHFANAFSKHGPLHYRVVHRHDIVPYVPVPVPFLEYEHVGELRYIEAPSVVGPDGSELLHETTALGAVSIVEHAVGTLEHMHELANHLRLGRFGAFLYYITDHALIYYSSVLWNEFVARKLAGVVE